MNAIFRVDASVFLGSGHVMRCLTLADELKKRGIEVSFVCCQFEGNFIDYICKDKGYKVHILPSSMIVNKSGYESCANALIDWEKDAELVISFIKTENKIFDWLIVDHYYFDEKWEKRISPYVNKIMVIDDLENRPHYCNLLLDQNYKEYNDRYNHLLPSQCCKLIGPKYTLLRTEFLDARKYVRIRDGNVKRILVFFGGTDPTGETIKALEALSNIDVDDINIDVVVGKTNLKRKMIKELCDRMPNTNYYCQINNISKLMAEADLAIGAGGTATWERCFMGLPCLTIVVAQNQYEVTKSAESAGILFNLGWSSEVSVELLQNTLIKLINNGNMLGRMSERSLQLMGKDIYSGTESVVDAMLEGVYADF